MPSGERTKEVKKNRVKNVVYQQKELSIVWNVQN